MSTPLLTLLKQGLSFPKHFIEGRMQQPTTTSQELQPGEGALIDRDGQKVAAYKTADGRIVALSPICTHMGCTVGWNGNEKTWDCPCHGSRYDKEGKVIQGPATKDLPTV